MWNTMLSPLDPKDESKGQRRRDVSNVWKLLQTGKDELDM